MPHRYGKKYREAAAALEADHAYAPDEAVSAVRKSSTAKFDESIEAHVRLGVDPRHADQMVRSSVVLPHGTGRTRRIAVFATGEKAKEALDAGADLVGGDDLVKKVQAGEIDFDVALATPDLMGAVGRLGKVLGPRGLMPNPKAGTVTFDIAKAVRDVQGGRVEFRNDRTGIIHTAYLEAYADRVLARVEKVAPGFTDSVLHRQVIGPHQMQEEYGLVGGNIFHGELSLGQMFHARPAAGYADLRTPVRGLYQAGSATHGGGGVTGIPGRNVVSRSSPTAAPSAGAAASGRARRTNPGKPAQS